MVAKGDKFDNIFEVGHVGRATVDGGAGDDQVNVWHKKDVTFDGGTGTDKVVFAYELGSFPSPKDGVTIDLASGKGTNPFGGALSFKDVEDISGTRVGDMIIGDSAANVLYGGWAARTS